MRTSYSTAATRRKRRKSNGIPDPRAPGALTVTDGHEHVGTVVPCDGSFFAFGTDNVLIGEYRSQAEAMRAIPNRVAS